MSGDWSVVVVVIALVIGDPQIKAFCTVTLGRLADAIRAELAAEAA